MWVTAMSLHQDDDRSQKQMPAFVEEVSLDIFYAQQKPSDY